MMHLRRLVQGFLSPVRQLVLSETEPFCQRTLPPLSFTDTCVCFPVYCTSFLATNPKYLFYLSSFVRDEPIALQHAASFLTINYMLRESHHLLPLLICSSYWDNSRFQHFNKWNATWKRHTEYCPPLREAKNTHSGFCVDINSCVCLAAAGRAVWGSYTA